MTKLRFDSLKQMRQWLQMTDVGQALVAECTPPLERPALTRCLAVTWGDVVEIFGPRDVIFKEVRGITGTTQAAEILAQDLVELSMPRCYRDLYEPGCLRGVFQPRPLSAWEYVARRNYAEAIQEAQEARG